MILGKINNKKIKHNLINVRLIPAISKKSVLIRFTNRRKQKIWGAVQHAGALQDSNTDLIKKREKTVARHK